MTAPVILVEAAPRQSADGTVVTIRLAGGGAQMPYHYGDQHWQAGITGLPRSSASLDFDGEQLGGGGSGEAIEVSWAPSTKSALSTIADLYWTDAPITVRVGPEGTDLPEVASTGLVMETAVDSGVFKIALGDQAADLKRPLLIDRFAGTGGLEGPPEFADLIKSRAWGRCFNVPGRQLDAAHNIWCFGDPRHRWLSFDAIRDKGVAATAATLTVLDAQASPDATFQALQATPVIPGGAVLCPSIACVKWWTTPAGDLHADIRGEIAGGYVETAPEIVARLVAVRSTIPFAGGTVAAAVAARPAPFGWRVDTDSATAAGEISDILGGVSTSWLLVDGAIVFRQWDWLAPTRVARSFAVTRKSSVKPTASRKLGYRRNWAPMARGDLAAIVLVQDIIYDDGTPIADAITNAGTTADWGGVSGPKKPEDNATVGGTIGVNIKLPNNGGTAFPADIINPHFDLGPDGRLTAIDFDGATKELGKIDLDAIGGASKDALAGAMAALDQADQALHAMLDAAVQRVDGAVADARNQADQALGAAEGRLDQKVNDANQAIGAAEGRLDRALTDAATANQAALQRLTDALGTLEDTSADAFAAGDGARRVVEDAIDKLSQAQLAASLTNGATRQILAAAGIYIDPASGTARIYGVDKAANDITEAEIRLSAAEGSIKLRVTRTDLDAAILTAQLGGANADLGPLLSRIANAEINLDALGAAIRLKADQTLLGELAGRVTTVRADLDAATGALSLKADSATVTGLNARVASAEATLTALGDVSSYATSASAIRLLDGQAADNAENTLRALLASDAGARSNVEQLGLAYQSLTARIIDGDTAEAQQRNLLTVRVRDTEASILTERLARVDAVSAIAGEIETFRADMDGSLGVVGTKVAAVSQAGESTATTVRVIGAAVDQDGDAALRAMLAGDAAAASAAAQIAVLREETVTRSVAGELSLVATRQDLIARLAGNSAQFTVQIATLADTTQTISRRVETFTATFNAALGVVDNRTTVAARDGESTATTVRVIGAVVDQDGDAALRALLAGDATGVAAAAQVAVLREETTSRMVAGELSLITTRQDLIARLNGNSASFSREISTLTDQQQSLARDVTTIRTQFDGNTADVSSKLIALAAADQTLGGRIDAFRAAFDGNAAQVGSQLIALAAADQTLSGRIDAFRAVFDGNAADVGSRLIALAAADQTLSGRIDAFRAVFDGNAADVSSRLIGLATADQTLSGRIDAFRAAYDDSTADVASQLIALATGDQTLAGRIDQFRAIFDGNTADVASKLIALATADQTLSGQIETFRAVFDGNTADVASKLVALATADETLGGRIDAFRAVFDGNAADVGSQLIALAAADRTLSGRIDDFRAVFDGNAADVDSQLIALAAEDRTLSGRIDDFRAAFDGNTADVASKLIALATADQTLGGRIDAFRSVFDGNTADVSSKLIALATADQSLSGRIDAFRSVFDGNTADVDSQLTTLATADRTLAGRLDRYGADFDDNKAAVQTQLVAQADATGAVAGHLETLQTELAGNTAKITETSSSVDGLKLKRGVELNSNGHITGWQANNDGSRGDFTIVTDTLKVIRPGATAGEEGHTVFAIGDDDTVYVLGKLRAGSIEADMLQVNSAVVPAFATFSTTIDGPGWDGSAGEGGSAGGRVIDEKMS